MASSRHLLMQMVTGRFRGISPEMKQLQGRILHLHGEAFNDRVVEALRKTTSFRVWARFDLPNQLGDVDVLVFDEASNRLWVIECKDFEMTRVPADLRNDIEDLKRAQSKQVLRADWMKNNFDAVTSRIGIPLKTETIAAPLIVVSALQLPVYLEEQRVPVVHVDALSHFVSQ